MENTKPLFSTAAAKKVKEMLSDGSIAMFCCNLDAKPFDVSPLATQGVDEDGTVWFFSVKDSDRNGYLAKDSRVQLIYGNSGDSDYLSLYGKAEIVNDLEKVKELWSTFAKVWFQEGPTDPSLTLVRFDPSEGFYWDTKNGKMVATAKMVASLVTGKTMDDSVEGKLTL